MTFLQCPKLVADVRDSNEARVLPFMKLTFRGSTWQSQVFVASKKQSKGSLLCSEWLGMQILMISQNFLPESHWH